MKKISLILFLLIYVFNYKLFAVTPPKLTMDSSAFQLNTFIPSQFTCNGADQSPPLAWHNVPPKAQSLVLIMQDPDAPNGVWTHWILFNIPPSVTELEAGSPVPSGALNGKNSWGGLGYRGPCPPLGAHRYVFKLYAVDKVLDIGEGATADTILDAITGHVLANVEFTGLYQK